MYRRDLLRGAASIFALSSAAHSAPACGAAAPATRRRRRPTDSDWPDAASWRQLNDAVKGNLIEVHALFAPCLADHAAPACRRVVSNINNPFYIGDQVAGTQVSGWLDAWTPAPSSYAIAARNTADVIAGVNFARDKNLRLAVKGAGHSYQGTSNAADSLLIWTRAMNKVTLHDRFVPQGCEGRVAPVPAVTAQAGAVWIDLYHAVTALGGRYVQGGGCTDVGVAGLIQSGGFGSFSKGFGTAASGLLEAEIVTADGRARRVNAGSDADLFWAIKGGGGGSWGVITQVTLRTHELPEFFGAAWGKIKARSDAAFRLLIARFVDFYAEALFNPHWGEQVSFAPDNTLEISMVCQGLDPQHVQQVWTPFFDWVKGSPQDFSVVDAMGAYATDARHWWDVQGNPSMTPDAREGAAKHHGWWNGDQGQVGAWLHGMDSLWLPSTLLQPSKRPHLVDALLASSRHKEVELHFNKGLAGAPSQAIADAKATASNPALCAAFALAMIAGGAAAAYPGLARPALDKVAAREDARKIASAASTLRQIAPDAGSYVSESDFFNRAWQREFWGDNFRRLQTIKTKYDPDGLFFVHHGVGSEAWSSDGFTRL